MPRSNTTQALERLGYLLNSGSIEQLKLALGDFEQIGLQKDKIINFPMQRYNGRTAVHLAAGNGLFDCLELLLKCGGNPNSISSLTDLSQTPLHLAASKGYPRCIQALLDHGGRIDIKNTRKETPLNLVKGKVNCEKVFQHAIAKNQIPQRTNLQQRRVESLHEIIGVEESLDEFYVQYDQLAPDHVDLATRWTDFYQQTLLYRAASGELLDVVKYMLSKSKNQPLHNLDTDETPLLIACRKSLHDIAAVLLNHSPKLVFISEVRNKLSPLHVACSRGDVKMVELILEAIKWFINSAEFDAENEVNLDFRDELGRTPLYNACYYGFFDVVKLLVEFQRENSTQVSFNINAAVKVSQRTPLHAAVRKGCLDIVQLLLTIKDIDINVEGRPSGRTQSKLIQNYQKSSHGREGMSILERHQKDTIPEMDEEFVKSAEFPGSHRTPEIPLSPPGTRTPEAVFSSNLTTSSLSLASQSSLTSSGLHIDDSIGFIVAPPPSMAARDSYGTLPMQKPTSPRPGYSTMPTKRGRKTPPSKQLSSPMEESGTAIGETFNTNKKRSQTDAEAVSELGESNLQIHESPKTGRLEFQVKGTGTSSGKDFDLLFMSPLAEACACYHTKIMRVLLLQGARDDKGLACRIAHLIQRPDLVRLILSFHTVLKENLQMGGGDLDEDDISHLELNWSHLKLQHCEGEWLGAEAEFYPLCSDLQDRALAEDSFILVSELGTPLRTGPEVTVQFDAVRVVHLDNNQLLSVPIELFQLQNVHKIDLSHNRLARLPTYQERPLESTTFDPTNIHGWACPCLMELMLSYNELTHLPGSAWGLPNITKLLCSKNRLETLLPEEGTISEEILSLTLEVVDVSSNSLKGMVSRFLFELPNLRTLNLSGNMIAKLPDSLWDCTTLHELNVSSNKLSTLPWCEPEQVYLDSSHHNNYSFSHPAPIRNADVVLVGKAEVKAPGIDRNKSLYQRAPSTIRPLNTAQEVSTSIAGQCDYSSLQKLNISGNKFSLFPEALACFAPNVTDLDVSRNPLKSLDVQFLPPLLKKLTAKNCAIERLGNTISRKHQVQINKNCRHGSSEGLACQHRSHTHLAYLSTMDLSANRLTHMQLTRQVAAEVDFTNFGRMETDYDHKIAPALDLLYPSLEGLNLIGNCLEGKFNPNIGHQTHLKWIRLNGNEPLTMIPMEFAFLKNTKQLTELGIKELPNLVEPPAEYQQAGLSHLLTYMRSRLKESNFYRCIKLFFIGNGERGKTTLLRRLRSMAEDKHVERTAGIDIESWVYPDPKKWREKRNPVHFLAWDFAGQEVYHTTHQCFYSKRSMYLALFRLTDGEEGIEELEQWLRSVQLRAPGCPVIIVGTHLDAMPDASRVKDLEKKAMQRYSKPNYPKIVGVVSISCIRKLLSNKMEDLRVLLYNVACHLSMMGKDGMALEYRPDMSESDPKALFQQRIPQTFLSLQEQIRVKVSELKAEGKSPIMEDAGFKSTFRHLFDDEDELGEAVYFLNLQGTLLHFEDHNLRDVYFLDPQWLAKLMADVIHPAAMGTAEHIKNGVAEISHLFTQRDTCADMKARYISLLEKFEVALKINHHQMIIPSLMSERASYPKPDDVLSDIPTTMLDEVESLYQPPLRRFWLADFVPAGFWPRLICRVATDQQIGRVLRNVIGIGSTPSVSPSESVDSNMDAQMGGSRKSPTPSQASDGSDSSATKEILNWTPWKTGMAFSYRGRTLMTMTQSSNDPCDEFMDAWQMKLRLLKSKQRIEVHIYINEWVTLTNELLELNSRTFILDSFECIPGLATKLLIMVTGHVKALALNWFPGMLKSSGNKPFVTHMPCWKCYAEIGSAKALIEGVMKGNFICKEMNPVSTFVVEDHIVTAALGKSLECCIHGNIKIMHMAPDLIFWDLSSDTSYQDSTAPLHICEDEVLGKGGFGFVCKGEIQLPGNRGAKKNVAVKLFLEDITAHLDSATISELLEMSKQPKHLLFAYREIRQEVSFLSNLDHQNLTKLCGVRTSPYMCLMLELAPKKSLRAILKEYKECALALEPLTLKNTALQMGQGLEYLHSNQVVHLDMKSPNVLIWHFPSPRDNRQVRIKQSGNVWIKIADYGISQVSTGLTLRVDNKPVGTPGFMAPELFDRAGQVVSSDKVDVFAYGMVLFELLSQRSPFDDIQPALKRNYEVRDGSRPSLQAKETRTLICLQELMELCWDKDPQKRPTMTQAVEWIRASEFERLRAEIALREVKSISCACICRILPKYEKPLQTQGMYDGVVYEGDDLASISFDDAPLSGSFELVDDRDTDASIDLVVPNMIESVSTDNMCIESLEGGKISNDGEDVYRFVPRSRSTRRERNRKGSVVTGGRESRRNTGERNRVGSDLPRERRDTRDRMDTGDREDVRMEDGGEWSGGGKRFDPYTQIWLCGRDQRKGLLQIFTYNDGHPGSYLFSGYCSRDEITSMCAVRNMMWMGTTAGAIKVFHAPTLKTKFTCMLHTDDSNADNAFHSTRTNRTILDILYVVEIRTVLVSSYSGEVWSFHDTLTEDGLRLQCKIALSDELPCYHLVKVSINSGAKIEVWGTMENNRLLVLERQLHSTSWQHSELVVRPKDPKLRLCSHIAFTSFTDSTGEEVEHVWVSYHQRRVLVSFNARTRGQRTILNCTEKLKSHTTQSFHITTLMCTDRKVLVGTTVGMVAIFDSETTNLLNCFNWHKDKVRTLLAMPREVEPCMCAEVPFPDQEAGLPVGHSFRAQSSDRQPVGPGRKRTGLLKKQAAINTGQSRGITSQMSYLENELCIHNPEPHSIMITSVGNGKRSYHVHAESKEDRVRAFNTAASSSKSTRLAHHTPRQQWEDVVLLTWRS